MKEWTAKHMANSLPDNEQTWSTRVNEPCLVAAVSQDFMSKLVTELDEDAVTAIILTGSVARGEATPYSDVDLTRFVQEGFEYTAYKPYTYREGRLISINTRTISHYREQFTVPQEAIFVIPNLREARILLDKDRAFRRLQQEAEVWTWEPLQGAADRYAAGILITYIEYVHKTLRAFLNQDIFALSEMTLGLFSALTDAIAVHGGMLVASGNTYFRQVQETVGLESTWSEHHRRIAGIHMEVSTQVRGIAALRLYQETARLLWSTLDLTDRETVAQALTVIDHALQSNDEG
jgi:Nucleotidyltransferase domain